MTGLIGRNPCKAGSVRLPRQPKRKITPPTGEQVAAVRAALPARWQPIVDCGAGLGQRQGEIFGMGPDEIDFLRRQVHVRRQVKRLAGRLWFALPKGGRERDIPLPAGVSLALAAHIMAYRPAAVTLPWNEPGSRRHGQPVTAELLFTSRQGGALDNPTFTSAAWQPACATAGITGGTHQLRYYYASVLVAGGVDVKALSEYLGHHDPAITLRVYSHLMRSAEGRALRAVEAAFAEADGPGTAQEGGLQ